MANQNHLCANRKLLETELYVFAIKVKILTQRSFLYEYLHRHHFRNAFCSRVSICLTQITQIRCKDYVTRGVQSP
jgi:hypothetical protein